jgi:porin
MKTTMRTVLYDFLNLLISLNKFVWLWIIWADQCNEKRNVRLFSGWSISDGNPAFSCWNGMVSLEGYGLIHGRENDRIGASHFYVGVSNDLKRLVSSVVSLQDLQGVELYYNAAITPWFHLTADLQIVDIENASQDTAVIPGLRANIKF